MQRLQHFKRNGKKGFTLVELLVVIAITAILLGTAVIGIIGYIDYANFKRQNEYAQSLFVAAQSALSMYSENGELEDIRRGTEGNAVQLTADDLEGAAKASLQALLDSGKNKIYTLTLNKKDGEIEPKVGGDAQKLRAVFDKLMKPYVYDKAILENASVTIEFDPVGGTVYSVLYSDMKNAFVYGEDKQDEGIVSIKQREEDFRRKRMVGYYGADSVNSPINREKATAEIDKVELINDNTLYLKFSLGRNDKPSTGLLGYEFKIYRGKDGAPLASFSLSHIKSLEGPQYEDLRHEDVAVKVDKADEANATKNFDFFAYVDSAYNVHVILDAVDLAVVAGGDPAKAEDIAAIAGTTSIRRLGLDTLFNADMAKDIKVSVKGTAGGIATKEKMSNTENMYFARETKTASGEKAYTSRFEIKNARHLYNIRFPEADHSAAGKDSTYKSLTYAQSQNLSWQSLFSGKVGSEVFDAGEAQPWTYEGELDGYKTTLKTAFTALPRLSANSIFDGGGKSISDLVLRSGVSRLGLVRTNSGVMQNSVLVSPQVDGYRNTGAFCGENEGALQDLRTEGGWVRGTQYVGGIVGRDGRVTATTETKVAYIDLRNSADVRGTSHVGGIIGSLANDGDKFTGTLDSCVNTGTVRGWIDRLDNPTQNIEDDINNAGKELGNEFTLEGHSNLPNSAKNMYYEFRRLNGDTANPKGYPKVNAFDREVMYNIVKEISPTVTGEVQLEENKHFTSTDAPAVAKYFGENYVWLPCALYDESSTMLPSGAKAPVTIVLVARYVGANDLPNHQITPLIYYNGRYYYYVDSNSVINSHSVTNLQDSLQVLTTVGPEGEGWKELDYTPTGFGPGSGNEGGAGGGTGGAGPDLSMDTLYNEPSHIGGIVGYTSADKNNNSSGSAQIVLKNCTSSQGYEADELEALLQSNQYYEEHKSEPAGSKPLLGAYSGGLVGYARNTQFTGSKTTGGYVVGSVYVGGVVGYYEVPTNGKRMLETLENRANVIGKAYVGGITGANTHVRAEKDANGFLVPDEEEIAVGDRKLEILGGKSYGYALATSYYGGGITGWNSGVISGSSYNPAASSAMEAWMSTYGGDYIGSIAGKNVGAITAVDEKVNKGVGGKSFIGGIVGFNGSKGTVTGYSYTGGSVKGRGSFVGGFAGYNGNAALITVNAGAKPLTANPAAVQGEYYVGGVVGANMVKSSAEINAGFSIDNALCRVTGIAYAGGQVGYNLVAGQEADQTAIAMMASLYNKTAPITGLEKVVAYTGETLDVFVKGARATASAMTLDGTANSAKNTLASVTGDLYVGGLIGYNHGETRLTVKNFSIKTNVTANSAIVPKAGAEEFAEALKEHNTDRFTNKGKTYSYSGAVTGKCTSDMVIENCSAQGTVKTAGTYTGGIVEINEGEIKNCTAPNTGARNKNYVGGIAGLNKAQGKVTACKLGGSAVTGNAVVGGLIAENFGSIQGENSSIQGAVAGYGEHVGGIAGISYTGANVGGYRLEMDVRGSGVNVGGAVGCSLGTLSNLSNTNKAAVSGNANVGGYVGCLENTGITNVGPNNAAVTAGYGFAGGYFGKIANAAAEVTFTGFVNNGVVTVSSASSLFENQAHAGGIAGYIPKAVTLKDARNNADIFGVGAGGIAGVNLGTITDFYVEGVTVTGTGNVGGIGGVAGYNNGRINGTVFAESEGENRVMLRECRVEATAAAQGANIGGFVGYNDTKGVVEQVIIHRGGKLPQKNLVIESAASSVNMGSIAGLNKGMLDGNPQNVDGGVNYGSITDASVSFTSYSAENYGNLGGLVGVNQGTLKNYKTIAVDVYGGSNNPALPPLYKPNVDFEEDASRLIYGVGGLVGVNGNSAGIDPELGTGLIDNCHVSRGNIKAIGSRDNIINLGGITGVNGYGSNIFKTTFAISGEGSGMIICATSNKNSKPKTIQADDTAWANIGVAAGYNYGLIDSIYSSGKLDASTYNKHERSEGYGFGDERNTSEPARKKIQEYKQSTVELGASHGNVGGMVGYNRSTGSIANSRTGSAWIIEVKNAGEGESIGGIVGRNSGAGSIRACDNTTNITAVGAKSYSGGIVGLQEPRSSGYVQIDYCVNYGNIEGGYAGGIVGVSRYRGLRVSSSSNYGTVKSNGENGAAGGIVGYIESAAVGDSVSFYRCNNYGLIDAQRQEGVAGGVLGATAKSMSGVSFSFYDCANTGRFLGDAYMGGIVGSLHNDAGKARLDYCRNYGNSRARNETGYDRSAGILSYALNEVDMTECLGIMEGSSLYLNFPIANDSYVNTQQACYAFTTKAAGPPVAGSVGGLLQVKEESDGFLPYLTAQKSLREVVYQMNGYLNDYKSLITESADSLGMGSESKENNKRHSFYLWADTERGIPYFNGATFILRRYASKPFVPNNLKQEDIGGAVYLTWEGTAGANRTTRPDAYDVTITDPNGVSRTERVYDNAYTLFPGNVKGQFSIGITAVNMSWSFTYNKFVEEKSPPSDAMQVDVKDTLATPDVRLVLRDAEAADCYDVVIQNAHSYGTDVGGATVTLKVDENGTQTDLATIQVENDGSYYVVAGDGTQKKPTVSGYGMEPKLITTQAEPTTASAAKYSKSPALVTESVIPKNTDYTDGSVRLAEISNPRFTGTTYDDLYLNLDYKAMEGQTWYYSTELLATDTAADTAADGLGVPVVRGQMESRISYEQGSAAVQLKSPDNLMDDTSYTEVTARMYPLSAINELVYTGRQTASGVDAAALRAMAVDGSGSRVTDGTGTLLLEGNTLKAGYSIIARADGKYDVSFNALVKATDSDKTQQPDKQVYTMKDLEKEAEIQPRPDLKVTVDEDGQTYQAIWDEALAEDASYKYELKGKNAADEWVVLTSGTISGSNGADRALRLDMGDWLYKEVRLRVTRVGEEKDGVTTLFPAVKEDVQAIRTRLSALQAPDVVLNNSSALVYDLSWAAYTDPAQQEAVEKYEIAVKTRVTTAESPGEAKPVTALFYTENANLLQHAIDLEKLPLGADGKTGVAEAGATAEISVRAIAKPDGLYSSSPGGDAYRLTVPTRLQTPDSSGITVALTDGAPVPSAQVFEEKGITVTYDGTNSPVDQPGTYELAATLEKAEGETEPFDLISEDAPLVMTGVSLKEAVTAAITKAEGLKADYARYVMRVKLRAISDGSISSRWSQEVLYPLPQVKLNALRLKEHFTQQETELAVDGTGSPNPVAVLGKYEAFSWDHDALAKSYEVLLDRSERADTPAEARAVDLLTIGLDRETAEPVVTLLKSGESGAGTALQPKITGNNSETVMDYVYEIYAPRQALLKDQTMPYVTLSGELTIQLVRKNKDDPAYESVSYTLRLPDAEIPAVAEVPGSVPFTTDFIKAMALRVHPLNTPAMLVSDADALYRDGADNALKPYGTAEEAQEAYKKLAGRIPSLEERLKALKLEITDKIVVPQRPYVPPVSTPVPTVLPTPSAMPTPGPSAEPTPGPSAEPTPGPSAEPTPGPSAEPTPGPSAEPTPGPSAEPTPGPSAEPTPGPTAEPTPGPTAEPTAAPTAPPVATPPPQPPVATPPPAEALPAA